MLSWAIFGRSIDSELGNLRYQLLYGIAGTLIEAGNQAASLAVFVVHEFLSTQTRPAKVAGNHTDLEQFIRSFPGMGGATVTPGKLIEGITVPGSRYVPKNIPILVGLITSDLGW